MTTTTLHRDVQRSRFLALAAEAFGRWLKPRPVPAVDVKRRVDPGREAADVRQMASGYLRTDPSFAADLYAAADRHERLAAE